MRAIYKNYDTDTPNCIQSIHLQRISELYSYIHTRVFVYIHIYKHMHTYIILRKFVFNRLVCWLSNQPRNLASNWQRCPWWLLRWPRFGLNSCSSQGFCCAASEWATTCCRMWHRGRAFIICTCCSSAACADDGAYYKWCSQPSQHLFSARMLGLWIWTNCAQWQLRSSLIKICCRLLQTITNTRSQRVFNQS